MNTDLLYQLALIEVPQVGHVHAKLLVEHFGTAEKIFSASFSSLERIEGIGTIRARNIRSFRSFDAAQSEIRFIEKNNIRTIFITDEHYPRRLLNCYDPPTLLFVKGDALLNSKRTIAIIGTRSNTQYGKQFTESLIKEIAPFNATVVSGLAFGIDAIAHKACVKYNVPTIAVLAHGFRFLYPPEHGPLVREFLQQGGGLITEHRSDVKPDKHNFPVRNRIVAGMCDATIVIETSIKGGSMITAELANGYNRDVFALPGKVTDNKSSGCNHLIRSNKAVLLTDPQQLIESLGWDEKPKTDRSIQRALFIELTNEEKFIVDLLLQKEQMHIDEMNILNSMSTSMLASTLLQLELKSVVTSLPGKMYKLN